MPKRPRKPTTSEKPKSELTEAEKAEQEFVERKKKLDEQAEQLAKHGEELEAFRRDQIRKFMNTAALNKAQLDCFVAVFSEMPGREDIAKRIMAEASKSPDSNPPALLACLVRMGMVK